MIKWQLCNAQRYANAIIAHSWEIKISASNLLARPSCSILSRSLLLIAPRDNAE